jgi:hypothetical protein
MAFPREKPAGKYEAGFGEGDENLFRRHFAHRVGKGWVSENKGLAADAARQAKKFHLRGDFFSPFWRWKSGDSLLNSGSRAAVEAGLAPELSKLSPDFNCIGRAIHRQRGPTCLVRNPPSVSVPGWLAAP